MIELSKEIVSVIVTDVPSLNKYYAGGHWTIRNKQANKFHAQVKNQLHEKEIPSPNAVRVVCDSHSRLDLDNRILAVKFTLDALKEMGYIKDDSPKYVKEIRIRDDPEMEKNTYKITLFEILL